MEKYTKQERHEIYKDAINLLNDYAHICNCILFVLPNDIKRINLCDFPEILKHKPENIEIDRSWWKCDEEGKNKRIEILKQAILETK